METVFYNQFERHGGGAGLKAHATHYCAGCGHGLAHKYIAESIAELGIQDRAVAVSPVGCSVFLYYYLDVGNTQAAHGRAPAVGIGHKLANPDSIVISYQGDGDLASIGLAEIMQAAQVGLPFTVVFINNAIYGMTGGQMAPTTLMNQRTATSPFGRNRLMGAPLKVAETIAQLDGPVYVERVALFNNKQRKRAQRAIKKALQIQMDGKGFAFVEVLAECPTHLKITPEEAEKWVEEEMVPVYPLGVKKDLDPEPWFEPHKGIFETEAVLDAVKATDEVPKRFATGFPVHIDLHDVGVKFAGAGGDGAQTAGRLVCQAAISEGYDGTYIPSYGPESRGGTSYADVHVAKDEVLSPAVSDPHALVVFNAPSLAKFGPTVRPGSVILYDSTVIHDLPELDPDVRAYGVPFTRIATELGSPRVKNVVALGAFQAATGLFPKDSFLLAMKTTLRADKAIVEMNERAFHLGQEALKEVSE